MKRKAIGFSGVIALLLAAFSCASAPAKPAPPAAATQHHSLWKVRGNNAELYLLGSVHVMKEDDYPLPQVIGTAFTNSGIAVFETDIDKLDDPAEAMKLMSKAQLPDGKTLETELSPAVYRMFTNHAAQMGVPLLALDQFTPAMAAEALDGMELLKLGFDPAFGLDKHFYRLAKQAHKRIVPLETIDMQMNLITSLTKQEGEWYMKTTIEEMDDLPRDFGKIMQAWKTGDAAGLAKLLNEKKSEEPALFKRLLTDRNERWMPQLLALANGRTNTIVIVGAGHLVGKDGLVARFSAKGYPVTQE
ncbi:MAG TPA: TraB/GumN family protein [Verrucomicrobiae bacterium]|nr:TraB/GumN family protein [Verrucomicrobiae bacterium]